MNSFTSNTAALAFLAVTLFQSNTFAAQHSESREIFWRDSNTTRSQGTSDASAQNPKLEKKPDTVKNEASEPARSISSNNDENSKANEMVERPHHRGGLQDR